MTVITVTSVVIVISIAIFVTVLATVLIVSITITNVVSIIDEAIYSFAVSFVIYLFTIDEMIHFLLLQWWLVLFAFLFQEFAIVYCLRLSILL